MVTLDSPFARFGSDISGVCFSMKLSGSLCKSRIPPSCVGDEDSCLAAILCRKNLFPYSVPEGGVLLVPDILRLGKAREQNPEEPYFCLVLSEITGSLSGDKCKLLCFLFS